MLWGAVAGRRVWQGKTEVEQVRSLLARGLPDLREAAPDTSESVLEIVKRATAVERDERFRNAQEMQIAIEQALAHLGSSTGPRELADFMRDHFGASRRAERRRLQAALRESPAPGEVMHCSPLTLWATALPIEELAPSPGTAVSRAFGRRKLVLAVAAGLALVGLGLGFRLPERTSHAVSESRHRAADRTCARSCRDARRRLRAEPERGRHRTRSSFVANRRAAGRHARAHQQREPHQHEARYGRHSIGAV